HLGKMQTLREIGQELSVSVNTVKSHVKAIYRKLGAADRGDAVRRGKALGILLALAGSAECMVVWAQFWSHSLLFTAVHWRPRTVYPGW
ncbi:MAG TPA: helix-turn-helix transcriptional regulator, partial [Candidatus Methylomirabilis sp.]|nr:helix-turn-helix transcriptional regulator [Candidatus Methylomirabilis sp.]